MLSNLVEKPDSLYKTWFRFKTIKKLSFWKQMFSLKYEVYKKGFRQIEMELNLCLYLNGGDILL